MNDQDFDDIELPDFGDSDKESQSTLKQPRLRSSSTAPQSRGNRRTPPRPSKTAVSAANKAPKRPSIASKNASQKPQVPPNRPPHAKPQSRGRGIPLGGLKDSPSPKENDSSINEKQKIDNGRIIEKELKQLTQESQDAQVLSSEPINISTSAITTNDVNELELALDDDWDSLTNDVAESAHDNALATIKLEDTALENFDNEVMDKEILEISKNDEQPLADNTNTDSWEGSSWDDDAIADAFEEGKALTNEVIIEQVTPNFSKGAEADWDDLEPDEVFVDDAKAEASQVANNNNVDLGWSNSWGTISDEEVSDDLENFDLDNLTPEEIVELELDLNEEISESELSDWDDLDDSFANDVKIAPTDTVAPPDPIEDSWSDDLYDFDFADVGEETQDSPNNKAMESFNFSKTSENSPHEEFSFEEISEDDTVVENSNGSSSNTLDSDWDNFDDDAIMNELTDLFEKENTEAKNEAEEEFSFEEIGDNGWGEEEGFNTWDDERDDKAINPPSISEEEAAFMAAQDLSDEEFEAQMRNSESDDEFNFDDLEDLGAVKDEPIEEDDPFGEPVKKDSKKPQKAKKNSNAKTGPLTKLLAWLLIPLKAYRAASKLVWGSVKGIVGFLGKLPIIGGPFRMVNRILNLVPPMALDFALPAVPVLAVSLGFLAMPGSSFNADLPDSGAVVIQDITHEGNVITATAINKGETIAYIRPKFIVKQSSYINPLTWFNAQALGECVSEEASIDIDATLEVTATCDFEIPSGLIKYDGSVE